MTSKEWRFIVPALALLGATARAQDEDHVAVYRKASESVVAVRAMVTLGERSGSGIILSKDGLVLTSYAVCPEGSTNIRVWTKGPRLYTAEFVAASKRDEIVLLRIRPIRELAPIETGDSSALRVGQRSYTIGNAANSIILDDQPSLNVGIVSALYPLAEERASATYTGPVFETTAAVNVGMEGAPCLDAAGRMVGFVTLNYSPHRFLGTAIPLAEILPVIERLKRAAEPATTETPPAGEGDLGLELKEQDGRLVVASVVPGGPADRAGFSAGDVVLEMAGAPLKSMQELADRLKGLEAGSIVWFKADIAGRVETIKVTL